VVSFFSPSGYEQRKLYSNADYVYYLPFDSAGNAKSFVESVQPIEVYFAKYDIWNHYLKVLSERNIPTYLVAANFRKGQIYFRWYGLFFKNMLKRFTHIYSQFEASTQLLKNNGIITSSTAGDTRYDRVMELANETVKLPLIAAFIENHRMMVIGSSYEAEEELTKQSEYKNYKLKLIVVPHDIDQHQIDATEKRFGASDSIRFSKADPESIKDKMILIVDNVGMLGRIYQYADIAIIGGGFGKKGIHNILEPLAHGVPVVIGSENHQKYPETLLAKESGVLFSVASSSEFNEVLKLVFSTEASGGYWKEKCKGFIRNHSGVTDSISREIEMKNYK
jgi:3-deoxy-D-manno-octulosonic-acid transferase